MERSGQSLVQARSWDVLCRDREQEAGRREYPGVSAHGLPYGPSETYPATALFLSLASSAPLKSLQTRDFRPDGNACGTPPLARKSPAPSQEGAKHPYEADAPIKSSIAFATESFDPRDKNRVGAAGDHEEDGNPTSRQAFSGRPARIVIGQVPETSKGSASPRLGEAGSQRPNQSSACQSREQRHTGPRTPLHVNEGRPRARYDKKEYNKCSQVEYDSC